MKKALQRFLAVLAKAIIKKYQPKIIGVTGSVGKTSAKEAIYSVLSAKFPTRKNIKNYNNELGVPLTIIDAESGGKSPIGWLKVFFKAITTILIKDKNYPEILVLEMGVDRIGDMAYLVDNFPCYIGVVTKVSEVHLEYLKSLDGVAKEKGKIVSHLTKEGFAILNFDDELVIEMKKNTKATVITFGYSEKADVRAIELQNLGQGLNLEGLKFKLQYKGSVVPVFLPNIIGRHQIYSAMAAAAVGVAFGMNLIEIADGLKKYSAPTGRMNIILGKNNSLIVDDTYNSSPEAATAAVEAIGKITLPPNSRRLAVMGDMLELGEITDQAHFELGQQIAKNNFQIGIFVGKFREKMAEGAKAAGLAKVLTFEDAMKLAATMPDIINANDLILIKGSQGSRMEKVVKSIMLQPEKAPELLVRQSPEWQ